MQHRGASVRVVTAVLGCVLLLATRQDEATRMQGYSLSADDFLAKPFDPDELIVRLKRMVDIRSRVQQRLRRELAATGSTPVEGQASSTGAPLPDLSERDARFLEKVRDRLERNHENPDASVPDMAAFLSMDARTLQRKLRVLTGRTEAQFHLDHDVAVVLGNLMYPDARAPIGRVEVEQQLQGGGLHSIPG